MLHEHFGRPRPLPERLPPLGPSFAPLVHEADGWRAEFSRRDAPEVDLTPEAHLMCVNFRTNRSSVYRYAGGREVRGTRHMGSAHLIASGHHIQGYTPDATDHVVLRLAPARLRLVAEGLFDSGDAVDLRTDGLPFFDAAIFRIAVRLKHELKAGNPGGGLAVEEATTALAAHLAAEHSSLKDKRRHRIALTPARLARVRDYVEANLATDLRIDALAAVAGVSVGHFLKVFREATGRSPHQYVLDRRVTFVRERLFDGEPDLAHLAVQAGFSSHSHMTQCFRRRIGITPSAFRAESC